MATNSSWSNHLRDSQDRCVALLSSTYARTTPPSISIDTQTSWLKTRKTIRLVLSQEALVCARGCLWILAGLRAALYCLLGATSLVSVISLVLHSIKHGRWLSRRCIVYVVVVLSWCRCVVKHKTELKCLELRSQERRIDSHILQRGTKRHINVAMTAASRHKARQAGTMSVHTDTGERTCPGKPSCTQESPSINTSTRVQIPTFLSAAHSNMYSLCSLVHLVYALDFQNVAHTPYLFGCTKYSKIRLVLFPSMRTASSCLGIPKGQSEVLHFRLPNLACLVKESLSCVNQVKNSGRLSCQQNSITIGRSSDIASQASSASHVYLGIKLIRTLEQQLNNST